MKKSSSKPQILSVDPLGTLNALFLFIKTLLNTEMQPLVGRQCSYTYEQNELNSLGKKILKTEIWDGNVMVGCPGGDVGKSIHNASMYGGVLKE